MGMTYTVLSGQVCPARAMEGWLGFLVSVNWLPASTAPAAIRLPYECVL